MKKYRIKASLSSNNSNHQFISDAKIKDNIIEYLENENIKVTLNIEKNILKRASNEMEMKFYFDTKEITNNRMNILEINKEINFLIKTKEITKTDKSYKVIYEIIDNDTFIYEVNIMED